MFAVVKIGAKQYLVKPGQKIKIEKIKNKKEGEEVVFDQVLLLENEKGEIEIGQPYLENKTLKGKILQFISMERAEIPVSTHLLLIYRTDFFIH